MARAFAGVDNKDASLDRNGDGCLSRAELIRALRCRPEVADILGLDHLGSLTQESVARTRMEEVFQVGHTLTWMFTLARPSASD